MSSGVINDVGESLSTIGEQALTAGVIFLVLTTVVHLLYVFLNSMLHMDVLWAQLIRSSLQFAIFIGCLIIILGKTAVMTLVGGLSIGFGYSLQPVIMGALQMIYLRSEHHLDGENIKIGSVEGKVLSSGLFHVKILGKDGNIYFVSNSKLTETIRFEEKKVY